jgi:hypothetical protein
MATKGRKHNSRRKQNRRSSGRDAVSATWRTTEKAALGIGRWMATDHTGASEVLARTPDLGFLLSLKIILFCLVRYIVLVAVNLVWLYVLVAYGLPLLLEWLF